MRTLLVSGLAALALAPLAHAGAPSACALVTASDAGKALGGSAKGTAKTLGLYRSCTYKSGRKTLTVLVRQIARADFEKSAKKNPGPVFPVPGVGDEAFSAGGGSTLLVWRKGTEITFTFIGLSATVQTQKDVANAAVKRL